MEVSLGRQVKVQNTFDEMWVYCIFLSIKDSKERTKDKNLLRTGQVNRNEGRLR